MAPVLNFLLTSSEASGEVLAQFFLALRSAPSSVPARRACRDVALCPHEVHDPPAATHQCYRHNVLFSSALIVFECCVEICIKQLFSWAPDLSQGLFVQQGTRYQLNCMLGQL